MSSFFYRVSWPGRDASKGGINPSTLQPLLRPGRAIRWRSSGAEYGLIEATIIDQGISNLTVRDVGTNRSGVIYIEQVSEVALSQSEAKQLNFGWPLD
jgi:hypothetical protein